MQKNLNIEKIIFKVVQMKFLAMHIIAYNFDPYNVLLAIAINILMTAFVLQGHMLYFSSAVYSWESNY